MVSSKVRQMSNEVHGSLRLYNSFHVTLSKGLYNTKVIYGVRAIDIDKPLRDDIAVSIRPKIIVGEGEDSYEKTPLYPE
jgi:hypothetical protein